MADRADLAMEDMRRSPEAFPRRPVPGTGYRGRQASESRGAFAAVPDYYDDDNNDDDNNDDDNNDNDQNGAYADGQGSAVPTNHKTSHGPLGRQSRSKRRASTTNVRSLGNTLWLAELASFALAVASFAAVVIILALYQDKPQPLWPSLVSLNSLISIFTSIFKAAMIFPVAEGIGELKWIWFSKPRLASDIDRFDSATRGPWGSLMLLFKRPGNLLAALGALITICALAIDPFAQQILQYYNCLEPVDGLSATITRTNSYTAAGAHGSADANVLDGAMAGAIYQGLLSPAANASASISNSCHSGNCTFPEANGTSYSSLAMCTLVEDISNLIIPNNSTAGNFSLPSGISVGSDIFLASSGTASKGDPPSIVLPSTPLYVLETIMLNVNLSVPGIQQGEDLATIPWAMRAYLYPCVHTYANAAVNNFILEEQIVSTTSLGYVENVADSGDSSGDMRFYYSLAGDYPSLPGTDCTPSKTPQSNDSQPTTPLPGGGGGGNVQVVVDNTSPSVNPSEVTWYNPGCTYFYGFAALDAQEAYLDGLLNAQNLTTTDEPAYTADGPLWFLRLYANGTANISSANAWAHGLANSMTTIIRQNGDGAGKSAPAQGTAFGNQTCVRVEWGWLALLAVLLFLTLLFLVGTVIQSHAYRNRGSASEKGRGPWKSSSLPLLWGGMADATKERYGSLGELHAMRECGDELRVKLSRNAEFSSSEGTRYGNEGGGLNKRGRWMLREEVDNR